MMQKLLSHARRCVEDYDMFQEGDRVAVGVSGGKDSLTLLTVLSRLSTFYPKHFTVEAVSIDMGYEGAAPHFEAIRRLCDDLGVNYTVVPTQIREVVFDIRQESNPCSLCANLRRGAVNEVALRLGCRKVALGHHRDDAIETFILSLFFAGRISCFQPVTYLDRKGVTLVRPLLYVQEKEITAYAKKADLPVMPRFCPADGYTKRTEVKELITDLRRRYPGLPERLFGAMQRYPLNGWEKVCDAGRCGHRPNTPSPAEFLAALTDPSETLPTDPDTL